MPNAGKHNVNTIDSFFKRRPSHTNIREGETVSFLEKGNLIKLEKRGKNYQFQQPRVSKRKRLKLSLNLINKVKI